MTKGDAEIERLKNVETYLKTQITTLEGVISQVTTINTNGSKFQD